MSKVLLVGGQINTNVSNWLNYLNIEEFSHVTLNHDYNITPSHLTEIGYQLRYLISPADIVITIGSFADKIITLAGVWHHALPNHTEKLSSEQLKQCKNYLIARRYYGTNNFTGPESS